MSSELWTVILAAGAGRRLRAVTGGVPKQYFAPAGGRTLIEETAGRVAPLSPRARRLTIVDRSHGMFLAQLADRRALGDVVYQPADRGTTVGILLGVTEILARDPAAVVVITPADHGISRPALFRYTVASAATRVRHTGAFVLFGVEPTVPSEDLGWISTDLHSAASGEAWCPVDRFCEKPDRSEAERLFLQGAVWNTMVVVARAAAVFAECERRVPEIARVFRTAMRFDPIARASYLAREYQALPASDFSRDILSRAEGLTLHRWPVELGWSDLGTPDRLDSWLRDAGARSLTRRPPALSVPA
jgi:mannose-1-phosphate guanylyltransferase